MTAVGGNQMLVEREDAEEGAEINKGKRRYAWTRGRTWAPVLLFNLRHTDPVAGGVSSAWTHDHEEKNSLLRYQQTHKESLSLVSYGYGQP
jgi:hypothetical protein